MRKRIPLLISAVLSACVLCVCLVASPKSTDGNLLVENMPTYNALTDVALISETVEERTIAVYETETMTEMTRVSPKYDIGERLVSLLNINHCYGEGFNDPIKLINAAAVTLRDYSADIPGYGICVNEYLVESFIENFYGVEISHTCDGLECPEGYIATLECENAIQSHELISVIENEGAYEVLSVVTLYYGGNDIENCWVKSVFVPNEYSDFGFNLISCEFL